MKFESSLLVSDKARDLEMIRSLENDNSKVTEIGEEEQGV